MVKTVLCINSVGCGRGSGSFGKMANSWTGEPGGDDREAMNQVTYGLPSMLVPIT